MADEDAQLVVRLSGPTGTVKDEAEVKWGTIAGSPGSGEEFLTGIAGCAGTESYGFRPRSTILMIDAWQDSPCPIAYSTLSRAI
jgi:hypothetical protein